MNRRDLIAAAGAAAAAGVLPGGEQRARMPPPPSMPNLVRIATTTRTRVGRHILLGCYCCRSGDAVVEYMTPGIVRSVTPNGRDYVWLIATDAPPEDLAWFGYDTGDHETVVAQMPDDVKSGRTRDAVEAELAAVRRAHAGTTS